MRPSTGARAFRASDDGEGGGGRARAAADGVVVHVYYPRVHDAGAVARVALVRAEDIVNGGARRGATRTNVHGALLSVAPWYCVHARGAPNERGDVEAEDVAYERRPVRAADLDSFLHGVPKRRAARLRAALPSLALRAAEVPVDEMLAAIAASGPLSLRVAAAPLGVYARVHLLQELVPRFYAADKAARLDTPALEDVLATLRTRPHRLCFRSRYPQRWPLSELRAPQLRDALARYGAPAKPAALNASELHDRMREDVKLAGHSYTLRTEVANERLGYYTDGLAYLERKGVIVVEDVKRLYMRRVHARKLAIVDAVCALRAQHAAHGELTPASAARAAWPRPPSGEQRAALAHILAQPVAVVVGRPGSGKSTLIGALVSLYAPADVVVVSFTGRAVDRLRRVVPEDMAHTLHHCTLKSEHAARAHAPLPYAGVKCIVVDEASMVEAGIFGRFLPCFPALQHLVVVGDGDQLPPLGYGDVLAAFSAAFPPFALRENHRASLAAAVISRDNAELMQRGAMIRYEETPAAARGWRLPAHPYVLVPRTAGVAGDIEPIVRALVAAGVAEDKLQIMTFMNRDCDAINAVCMRIYRSDGEAERPRGVYRVGDKICVRKNKAATERSSEVCNGEIGRLAALDDVDRDGAVRASPRASDEPLARGCERRVSFVSETGAAKQWYVADVPLHVLALGWCVTVHKMQGSEQQTTLFYMPRVTNMNMTRNLLYTATSRHQDQVIIVATRDDLARVIANPARPRRSHLAERLRTTAPRAAPPSAPDEWSAAWIADDADDAADAAAAAAASSAPAPNPPSRAVDEAADEDEDAAEADDADEDAAEADDADEAEAAPDASAAPQKRKRSDAELAAIRRKFARR